MGVKHVRARLSRISVAVIGTVAALASAASAASADQVQIAVQSPTPEQGIPVNLQFSGTAGAVDNYGDGPYVYAVVRPAGGVGCQSSFDNDQSAAGSASKTLTGGGYRGTEVAPGAYQVPATYSPPDENTTYLLCAWVERPDGVVTAGPVSATFSARGPQVSQLTVALASPARPDVGFQMNYTSQTDQQLTLYSIIKAQGGLPCASSYELDQQQNQSEGSIDFPDAFGGGTSVFGGPVTTAGTARESSAGPYLVCSWIEGPNTGEVDAAASTPIYVGTPPSTPPSSTPQKKPAPHKKKPVAKKHWHKVKLCVFKRVGRHGHRVRVRSCRMALIYS